MLAIIALVLIAVVAVIILTAAVHILFSPLLLIAIAVLVWLRFRPRRHV
jgi:threonine/homoserine/homoserine lactone efflux protein